MVDIVADAHSLSVDESDVAHKLRRRLREARPKQPQRSTTAGGGGESSRESAFSRRSSVWGGSGDNVFNRTNRRSSIMNLARVEVAADPVTHRLLTACNTDWRVQPKAIDVCKAATAAQVPRCQQPWKRPAPRTILPPAARTVPIPRLALSRQAACASP